MSGATIETLSVDSTQNIEGQTNMAPFIAIPMNPSLTSDTILHG